jgi:hypothetical protein
MLPRVIGGPFEARFPLQCVHAAHWYVCDIQIHRPARVFLSVNRDDRLAAPSPPGMKHQASSAFPY